LPNKPLKTDLKKLTAFSGGLAFHCCRTLCAGNNAADFIRWLFGAKRLTTSEFT